MAGHSETAEWKALRTTGLMEAIGPILARRLNDESWRYGLSASDRHVNHVGLVHGGTLAAFADQAMSLVAWEEAGRLPVVTVRMDTTFFEPARPGDFLEATAKLVQKKGSLLFMQADISAGERHVATASSVMKVAAARQREEIGEQQRR